MNTWKDKAACKNQSDLFVWTPPSGRLSKELKDKIRQAQSICNTCPVKQECYIAGKNEPLGIWGGVYRNRGITKPSSINLTGHRRANQQFSDEYVFRL